MTVLTAPAFALRTALGELTLEPLDIDVHAELLHAWVTHPRSAFWQMGSCTVDDVHAAYAAIAASPHESAWLGRLDGEPVVLAERYDPAHHELARHLDVGPGDVGMHVLVAPPLGAPRPGLTSAVMAAVMSFCFADPHVARVVVEPDSRNARIAAKNAEAGFVVLGRAALASKVATLAACTRAQFAASALAERFALVVPDGAGSALDLGAPRVPAHLDPALMALAHRRLVAKALGEFAHERLIAPVPGSFSDDPTLEDGVPRTWLLDVPGGGAYTFTARRYPLEHWLVDADSIVRTVGGTRVEPDALDLIGELRDVLGVPDHLLGTYLEEIAATLAGSAWKLRHRGGREASELVTASFQQVEAAMTEGHPAFVANNGRIGWGAGDAQEFAPEAGRPVRLVWLAARRDCSHLSLSRDQTEGELYGGQLGAEQLDRFASRLSVLGLDPGDYRYLPVHPWQWEHKVAVTFAADVAARRLVPVGSSDDRYQAQQSIRTFFDLDRPDRHYVKTALSVQNMGFLRGLSPNYMRATPAINDHVAGLVARDAELRACGVSVLREIAAVGYTGDAYHRWVPTSGRPAQQRMLAALWRESPVPRLAPGQRAMTMAALLHRDPDGAWLAGALVRASGATAEEWVRAYLRAYLRPLVHCLLAHDLAFMPHGENVILVMDGAMPAGALMKDIGEEVALMHERPLPELVERVRLRTTDEVKALAVFTDAFDGFLRFLAAALDVDGVLPARRFWALASECVAGHAADHRALHERLDLFADRFAHSCLNRLQLRNTLQMVDLADQPSSLQFAGTLRNPIAGARP
ncbi:MAG: GNAT family N-acetyltransferase [Kineosporiaceae bacterium]